MLLLVEKYVKDKITKECQTLRSQTYEAYNNNKYHSGITYQQVQHAHFGSRSSPIVVSHKKNKNFNSLLHFQLLNFDFPDYFSELSSRKKLFLANFVKLILMK